MILNKYNEIMERLTVSDEMREKLIAGAGKADQRKSRIFSASTVKRVAAIAISLLLPHAIVERHVEARGEVAVQMSEEALVRLLPYRLGIYKKRKATAFLSFTINVKQDDVFYIKCKIYKSRIGVQNCAYLIKNGLF